MNVKGETGYIELENMLEPEYSSVYCFSICQNSVMLIVNKQDGEYFQASSTLKALNGGKKKKKKGGPIFVSKLEKNSDSGKLCVCEFPSTSLQFINIPPPQVRPGPICTGLWLVHSATPHQSAPPPLAKEKEEIWDKVSFLAIQPHMWRGVQHFVI